MKIRQYLVVKDLQYLDRIVDIVGFCFVGIVVEQWMVGFGIVGFCKQKMGLESLLVE